MILRKERRGNDIENEREGLKGRKADSGSRGVSDRDSRGNNGMIFSSKTSNCTKRRTAKRGCPWIYVIITISSDNVR